MRCSRFSPRRIRRARARRPGPRAPTAWLGALARTSRPDRATCRRRTAWRPLLDPVAPRPGRNGRGVRGLGRGALDPGRAQDAPSRRAAPRSAPASQAGRHSSPAPSGIRTSAACTTWDGTARADDAIWFLTMELLRGETLAKRLQDEGRLPLDRAQRFAEQMAAGLGAAHQAGVVHRDFKTGNVMLVGKDGGEQAVVTDFGIARAASQERRTRRTTREAPARSSEPRPTWRPSRCAAKRSVPPPTSTRSGSCSTRW